MKFQWLYGITIFLLLIGCRNKCDKVNIPMSKENLFLQYSLNDTIEYISNYGRTDVFTIVRNDSSFTSCNNFELGQYQFETKTIIASGSEYHGTSDNRMYINVVSQNKNSCQMSVSLFDFDVIWSDTSRNLIIETITLKSDSLKPFETIHFYNGYNGETSNFIKSFYWSSELGVLKYITHKNEEFELSR